MPEFNNRRNFQVTAKEDNKQYWISRPIAVVALLFFLKDEKLYLPFVKRGQGMELYPGCWALVSGFLDFGESAGQGLRREVWEELGLDLQDYFVIPAQPTWVETEPNPEENDTISLRYCLFRTIEELPKLKPPRSPEVEEAQFIDYDDLHLYYPLAFNHVELVKWGKKQILGGI